MKLKNIKRNVIVTMLLLNLIIFFCSAVYALENTVTVSLQVKQVFETQNTVSDKLNHTGTYKLTGLSQDAPMPDTSKNETYTFTIDNTNDNNKFTIPLTYTHAGVYQYKLIQTTKDIENYIYDRTNYTITVYIKNGEAGQLIPEVIVQNGSDKKCGEINFTNIYEGKENLNPHNQDLIQTSDKTNPTISLMIGLSSILIFVFLLKKKKQFYN